MAIEVDLPPAEPEPLAVQASDDRRTQRRDMTWLAVGVVVITLITFFFGLWGSEGRLAPPLDDTFIHFQYARQLTQGHPFQFNTGDAPSSGDSAFIYPFLLAPAYLVGLGGMKALLYADALNFLAHLGFILLGYRLAYAVGGRPVALFTALFLLLDGRLNLTFLTGMETGLYAAALVAFFWTLLRATTSGGRFWLVAVTGLLAALLRTEGHILVSVVCLLTLVYAWRSRTLAPKHAWLLLPIIAGLVPYAVNIAMTGYWQFNTALSKSYWYVPYSPIYEKLSLTVGTAITAFKDIYLGLEIGRSPFPVLGLAIGMFGAAAAWSTGRHRLLHAALIITFIGGVALAHLLPPLHFYRYHQPYDFILWFYICFGLVKLAEVVARFVGSLDGNFLPVSVNRRLLFATWAAVTVLILPQFVAFLFDASNSTRDIYHQQMTFADWIRKYTPPDARIAVSDTGANKYLSDRYTIDVIGLTNNAFPVAHFSGWGTVFDILTQLPESQRPGYLLIHPNIALNEDESIKQGLLEPFYAVTVQNTVVTAGPTEMLYKINWDFIQLDAGQPYLLEKGKQPFDQLNVGDLAGEGQHTYEAVARQPTLSEPKAIVTSSSYEKKGPVLSDSGRRHTGWEQFSVKSKPGSPLTIVARSKLNPDADQKLLVWANGKQVGLWEVHNDRAGFWQEYEYTVPAQFITGDRTVIRLDATFDPGGPGFASYRYWVYTP